LSRHRQREWCKGQNEQQNLIDATQGRRTKSVIFMENDTIIVSALQPETLSNRFNGNLNDTEVEHGTE